MFINVLIDFYILKTKLIKFNYIKIYIYNNNNELY